MKILILVLSHNDGGIYTDFFNTQKETWGSIDEDGVKTYYYFGDSDSNYIEDDEIHLQTSSNLKNCALRTVDSFKMIINLEFDFLFRTNSSSYIDKHLLKKYLVDKPKNNFYSGILGLHYGIPFCSGSGFFMSKDLVKFIIDNDKQLDYSYIDDVCFGKFLSSNGIQLSQSQRFDLINGQEHIDLNFFHYRLKTRNRVDDINNMKKIYELKK